MNDCMNETVTIKRSTFIFLAFACAAGYCAQAYVNYSAAQSFDKISNQLERAGESRSALRVLINSHCHLLAPHTHQGEL